MSSKRINQCFDNLRAQGKKALVPFITAGDPSADSTLSMLHALVAAGADVIELGMPFSDPMADGPVVQKASERALAGGMTLIKTLQLVAQFRSDNKTTPIVLMGYLNPIEHLGYQRFAEQAVQAGVDGVLVVDLPPEAAGDLFPQLEAVKLAPIFLIAPTSTEERIEQVAQMARGYVYYVSLKGVTGSNTLDVAEVEERLLTIREHIDLPVGVGFGIKNAATAAAVARIADAVVVGSVLVEKMAQFGHDQAAMQEQVCSIVSAMRKAMDEA